MTDTGVIMKLSNQAGAMMIADLILVVSPAVFVSTWMGRLVGWW